MKKNLLLVSSYGFFLAWLLSFLYNGPAIDIVFNISKLNPSFLAIAYIITPSIILYIMGFYNIKREYKYFFMKYGVIVCFIGTFISILIRDFNNPVPAYVLAGIMGIFSVLFITGWSCYFVELLNIKTMYKHMAYVICLGNLLYHLNELLKYHGLNSIVIILIFLYLLCAYYSLTKLSDIKIDKRRAFNIKFPIDLLIMICFLIFLLNVGGGMFQTLVSPLTKSSFNNIYLLDIIVYILIGLCIYNLKRKLPIEITITIAMVMIACGYMSLILLTENLILAYVMIVLGYAILDIFLWSLVGEMGYIFGKPIRIFSFVMASNLLAVFMGNLLGIFLNGTNENRYLAISISAISTILAFGFLPFINQIMTNGISKMNEIKATRDAANDIVTKDKATELLTPKELEIYKLMLLGLKNTEIAEKANISPNTLKGHARKIYSKFEVKNKKELINSLSKEEVN